MIEDSPGYHQCRFCKSPFSDEILKKIRANNTDVYCEICGDIIKRVQDNDNLNHPDIAEIEPKTNIDITPVTPQKKLKPHPDTLKFPIGRIFYDSDFPIAFKTNFVVVLSRLVCFAAMRLDQEGEIELGKSEIPENALNDLYMSTRHIQDKRIKPEFLKNLRKITKDEFESNLKKLQNKIQTNRQYLEDLHVYTRWIIRKVYLIISNGANEDELSKFDLTLYKELENQILFINKPSKYAKIREYIRNLDWDKDSPDWVIFEKKSGNTIQLDPTKDCSLHNPLYRNPIWLNRIYNDVNYAFSDSLVSQIWNIHRHTIGQYRRQFNISGYYKPTRKPKLSKNLIEKREKIRNFDWNTNIDWNISIGRHEQLIILNPSEYCSPKNPLYKHKPWLKRVYEDEELDLNGVEIAKICGLKDQKPISEWRIKLGIPKKTKGIYFDIQGHKLVLTSDGYIHPQRGRIYQRPEHILVMERYLNKNLSKTQLRTHPDLIQGLLGEEEYFYIKKNCHVHHINYVSSDNRIDNLWLFSSNQAHGLVVNELHQCFSILIKLNQIIFKEGKYLLNQGVNCHQLDMDDIGDNLNPKSEINHSLSRFYDKHRKCFSVAMPKSYKSPFISPKKGMGYVYMLEHRYIIEQCYRALLRKTVKLSEEHIDYKKAQKFLNPQGFLKTDAIVHHINFDSRDNRLLNLYVCNRSEHNICHGSINRSVERLLDMGLIYFANGKYFLDNTLTNKISD